MPVNVTKDVRWPDPMGIVQVAGALAMDQEAPPADEKELQRLAAEKAKLDAHTLNR